MMMMMMMIAINCAGMTYSSCKAIRDSNTAVESGEYTIRTVAGNILDKVCESTVSIKR